MVSAPGPRASNSFYFNVETRQSNARMRRNFIEQRLVRAERELIEAEDKLKAFLETNKEYEGSPELAGPERSTLRSVRVASNAPRAARDGSFPPKLPPARRVGSRLQYLTKV